MRLAFLVLLLFVAEIRAETFETGTLLLVENSSNVIERYTDSSYTHVVIVVMDDVPWVYEAEPPKVRRITLEQWLTEMAKYNEGWASPALLSVVKPNKPYADEEIVRLKQFLESQKGEPYSLRGYLRNQTGDGIHCSQLCAGAIEAVGRLEFSAPNHRISPEDLRHLVGVGYRQHGRKLCVSLKREFRRTTCTRWSDWWVSQEELCRWSYWEALKLYW